MEFLGLLFFVCVGGGWLFGKLAGNVLFPKKKDPLADFLKNYKEPPVINNHYHTHIHHHQNLTIIDDETKKKVLELNNKKAT